MQDFPLTLEAVGSYDSGGPIDQALRSGPIGVEQRHGGIGRLAPVMFDGTSNRVWRFSLRPSQRVGVWRPQTALVKEDGIQSGDPVNLYCHSLGLGPFATLMKPPVH